jgi:hypothetical protein
MSASASTYPTLPCADAPAALGDFPFRLESARVDLETLFTAAELAAWREHLEDLRPDFLQAAFDPDELGPRDLAARIHGEALFGGGDPTDPEDLSCALGLQVFLLERAVRTAHQEKHLFSPLLGEVLYARLPVTTREAISSFLHDEGQPGGPEMILGVDAREQAFADALAEWALTREDGFAVLRSLQTHWTNVHRSLLQGLRSRTLSAGGFERFLDAFGYVDLDFVADALVRTPEAARVLGEHTIRQIVEDEGGMVGADAGRVLHALERKGLWTWRPSEDEVRAHVARAYEVLMEQKSDPAPRGSLESRYTSADLLIDYGGRGEPLPSLGELIELLGDDPFFVERLAGNRHASLEELEMLARHREQEHPEWSDEVCDVAWALAIHPTALESAPLRRWLLQGRRTDVLEQILPSLRGVEYRLAFRRLSLLAPADAVDLLENEEERSRWLLKSDLAPLLASSDGEARMRALQFLQYLPEGVDDPLPAPVLRTSEKPEHPSMWAPL